MSSSTRRGRLRDRYDHHRARLDAFPRLRTAYKLLVAVVGLVVVVVGLILVPLPGPGWLIVFVGVAVLGTEFPAAHRVTEFVRRQVRRLRTRWRAWRAARSAVRAEAAREQAARAAGGPAPARPSPRPAASRASHR